MRKTENIINRTGINKTECKKTGHSKENKIPGVKCTPKIELYLSNFKGALHWWNGSLFFLIIILGITLGIFAGCKNIFVPEPPATPEAAGPGGGITVPLRLFTGSARSVKPGMKSLIWEITATSGGAKATVLGEYPDFKIYFPSKGEWTIEVKGKSGTEPSAKEIFTGNTTLEITGSTTSISIPLSPGSGMEEGTGTIDLTMTVPTDVNKVMYKLDSDTVFTELTLSNGSCSLNKTGVSARIHTLSLYFLDDTGMTVYMCTETVNVWNGLTSDQWVKTSGADHINDNGEFELTKEIIDNFLKTMGSVVYVDASVDANTPGTGSIFAPVKTVTKAVEILRKANPDRKYSAAIMVTGATEIESQVEVNSSETLTVKGMEENASITNSSGRVFKITGGSLTLGENITLTGTVTDGNGGAVYVNGGTFTMEDGSKIIGSRATGTTANGGAVYVAGGSFTMSGTATIQDNTASTHGGGVHILSGGTFTMNGGTIGGTAQNTATYGGGVFVSGGTFNMNDGTISGNTVTQSGGGVFVQDGTFNMKGSAIIQDNEATSTNSHACGGGVYIYGGNFTMSGEATIQGNNASTTDTGSAAGGGGVYVNVGTFTMTGTAKIQGNTTSTGSGSPPSGGGGVFVIAGGTFTMSGGSIGGTEANSANEADLGGGVYVGVNADTSEEGSFTMGGGTIKGNTATQNGGGVYVGDGTFTMNGGIITGNTTDGNGAGVYLDGANAKVTLNNTSSISGNLVNNEGGGVYVGKGIFTLSGTPNISGNLCFTDDSNVYLTSGKIISIGDEGLTGGTIGVTAEEMVPDGSAKITNITVPGADTIFTSDVDTYSIAEYKGAVYLSDAETKYVGTDGTETLGLFKDALAAVNASGGTITLLKDIDGSSNAVFGTSNDTPITFKGSSESISFILDLNGKTINRELDAAQDNGSVIKIEGGTLTIKDSSATNYDGTGGTGTITGGNSSNTGGGIHITSNYMGTVFGSLILKSGNISGNTADVSLGGGIYIGSDCAFTMKGGSIDGNTVKNSATSHGGGVFVGGTFTMENGIITSNSSEQGNGGGVNIGRGGVFTMSDGTISDNDAGMTGGGVNIDSDGVFTMSDGTISANNAGMTGGGVNLGASGATMTLEDGTISGNTASYNGGGVGVSTGNFTMSGGTLSGNTATNGNGGGVYVHGNDSNFTMTSGTISGNTATQKGGGVYVSSTGSFTLGSSSTESSPVVSGNTETGNYSSNNVYLDDTILLIVGKLEKTKASGNIGITMAIPGEEFTYEWDSSGSTEPTFFFSDDTKRTVALSGSELSLNLVRVEGGSCELNSQSVTLSSFWISPYEVTQEEFKSIMTGNKNVIASKPSYFQGEGRPPADGEEPERRPVEQVRWYEAIVYCNLLSMKEGLTPCYTIKGSTDPALWGNSPTSNSAEDYDDWKSVTCNFNADGYRLPTEAEWEYAARGGQTGQAKNTWNCTYSGSNTINEVAWYGGDSGNSDKTHEVGKKNANALGLYDMSGNAGEWCWDWRSESYPSNTENPAGPDTGERRVLRGGSINNTPIICDVEYQNSADPWRNGFCFGFRVVRSIR